MEMQYVQGLRPCLHFFRVTRLPLVRGVKMATVSQRNVSPAFAGFEAYSVFLRIAHFTVTGYEARFDLVLIHFVLLYYVNHALLVLTNTF